MANLLKNASLIQQTLDTKKKQEAASTAASQSGSTNIPTQTTTPKVTQPKKTGTTQTTQTTQPVTQTSNLFGTSSVSTLSNVRQQTGATGTKAPDLFAKEEEPYQSHLQKWFNIEPGEKTKEVVTNLFDKLRPASQKIVETGKALKDYREVAKTERKEATKDFEKRYTPEGLKQYFNYYEDTLGETVRPMAGNVMYTSLNLLEGATNWVSSTIESISSRVPDQGLLVRKGILPASQTQEEIEEEKKRLQANMEAITASILDTVYAGEKWMDSTEIGKETKAVEGMSLLDALKKGDTNAVRGIIGNQIGYILPSVGAGIVGGDVGVASSIFPVMYQETLDDYMNDPSIVENNSKEKIHWMATASAGIQTAIEIVSLETQILKPIRNTKLSNEISKKVTQPVVSRILGQWIKGSIAEGVEEVSQQWVEQKFAQLLGSNRALLTVDDYADIGLEAFIMGLIISGPGAVVEGVSTKRQTLVYNENIRRLREEIPGLTEDEAKEILNAVIDYEEKEEDVSELEDKATKLYENKQNITNQINQLKQNPTQTSEYEIPLLENQLQDINNAIEKIDNKINDIYKPIEEITKKINKLQPTQEQIQTRVEQDYTDMLKSGLESIKDELLLKQQTQLPKEEGGKNLSEQTMGIATKETARELKTIDLNKKGGAEKAIALENRLKKASIEEGGKILFNYDSSALRTLENFAYNTIGAIERGSIADNIEDYRKILEQIKYARNEQSKLVKPTDEDVASKSFEELRDEFGAYFEKNGHKKEDIALAWTAFTNTDTEVAQHLVGLTNSQIKKIERGLSEKDIMKINEYFARVSSVLGIDFNLVVDKKPLGLAFTNTTLLDDENMNGIAQNLGKAMAVMVTNKNGDARTESTVCHELAHIIDFAYHLVTGKYLLKGKRGWNTYRGKKAGLGTKYASKPVELWARFNQQYMAYQDYLNGNKALYEEMTTGPLTEEVDGKVYRTWASKFWDNETFLKLLPEFQDIYNNEIYSYKAAEGNQHFYDVMKQLNGFRTSWQIIDDETNAMTDEEFLKDIKQRQPDADADLVNKIVSMRNLYKDLLDKVNGLQGVISDEIRKEYMTALDLVESNLDLITSLGDKYLEMEENTEAQQNAINEGVNTIADNAPQLISEIEENKQDGDIIDDVMEPEMKKTDEDIKKETKQTSLKTAVDKTVDRVIEKSVTSQVKSKNNLKAIREVGQGIKDVFTPALSRLYSISPRLAGAVHTYQAMTGLKSLKYKTDTKKFVEALHKLKKKNPEAYKKLSLAMFDYGMVEGLDIKEELQNVGIDPKLFEPVAEALNSIAQEYKEAGLKITINDKYFPRKVRDYGLLLDYLSRKAGVNIKDSRATMLQQIKTINEDTKMSEGQKEARVRELLTNNFVSPSQRSSNAKERKLILSEWLLTEEEKAKGYKNDITDFYEDPIVALDMYIEDMVKKTELRKMLGGLTEDKSAISEKFDDSIAKIVEDMEARGELTEDQMEEAKKVINAIINARATPSTASGIKNLVYSMTIANWLSAAQQLEDLSKTLLRGPSGFKNIVKSLVGKAGIKMDDTGLENAFAAFEGGNITDALFKLSGFDAVDALGKKSFLNTAFDSCVRRANSEKKSIILKTRLTQMYGEKMGNSIFESYKNNELRDENKKLKLDVMTDLLYQLGNTQPIYKSAMPTAYLNNPKARVMYCLLSFTVKQVDRIIQGTKEVYNNQRLLGRSKSVASLAATGRCTGAMLVISMMSALVTDLINWAKGDDDELMFKKWKEEGFMAFLKQFGLSSISGLLKIFNISRYDQYIFNREGIDGVIASKVMPAPVSIMGDVGMILLGKEELADMGRYMPLFLKPLYYQFKNRDMLPDYKLWGGTGGVKPKFGNNGLGGSATPKFGKY